MYDVGRIKFYSKCSHWSTSVSFAHILCILKAFEEWEASWKESVSPIYSSKAT